MKNGNKTKVIEVVPVWVVRRNTDLTEGRGIEVVSSVCHIRETAKRLAYKKGVQGTDASVTPGFAIIAEIDGNEVLLVPGEIECPSKDDKVDQKMRDDLDTVLAKATAAGLTADELKLLRGGLSL